MENLELFAVHKIIFFKRLVAWCHSFCLFFIFYNIHTYIHTITFIPYIYPSAFTEASLHFFIASLLSGGPSLWCRAENRTRACLPASRRATNCATPHHELCHAAPLNCATPHHSTQNCLRMYRKYLVEFLEYPERIYAYMEKTQRDWDWAYLG